jgi:hypothetical protein
MDNITIGFRGVVGVKPIKPLKPLPQGKIRIRMRSDEFATAYVRDASGIKQFALQDNGETWSLAFPMAENRRFGFSSDHKQAGGLNHVTDKNQNAKVDPAPDHSSAQGDNPFACSWAPGCQDGTVEDRLHRVKGFTAPQCEAALKRDDLQKTVRLAVERRLRKLTRKGAAKS